jgi:hypothetical protein
MDTLTVIGMNIGVIAVVSRFPLSAVAAGEETPKQVRGSQLRSILFYEVRMLVFTRGVSFFLLYLEFGIQ